jgi:hypothetical protein
MRRTRVVPERAQKAAVVPTKAGIHSPVRRGKEPPHQRQWIPAFAGMTRELSGRGCIARLGKGRAGSGVPNFHVSPSPSPSRKREGNTRRSPQPIVWPVFAQSAMNDSMPLSVSGCLTSCLITAGGAVITSAPILAACSTWIGWRTLATRISVPKS